MRNMMERMARIATMPGPILAEEGRVISVTRCGSLVRFFCPDRLAHNLDPRT